MDYSKKDFSILDYISKKLVKEIEINNLESLSPEQRFKGIEKYLREIIDKEKIIISERKVANLVKEIYEDSFGFGPVSFLINDDRVTEIMINNYDEVYIERDGLVKKTNISFKSNSHIRNLVEKILSPLGLRIDESSPMVDARLKDGSRINVVVYPISLNEITVTIRKFRKTIMDMDSLIRGGTLDKNVADFIEVCVQSKLNIIISGATATGKTTFLNVISNFIPSVERIITIEDTLELNLNLPHVVRLESRPPNLEGRGEVTIRDLVRNSLRMRPDRILVGEIRGVEAVDVLQAMNTGHSGSMSTVHANSPRDLISRLETMLLMAGLNLNPASARRIIASSVDLIIHLERKPDGRRILARVSELVSNSKLIDDNATLGVKDIFIYKGEDLSLNNNNDSRYSNGQFFYTGYVPTFVSRVRKKGFDFSFTGKF